MNERLLSFFLSFILQKDRKKWMKEKNRKNEWKIVKSRRRQGINNNRNEEKMSRKATADK